MASGKKKKLMKSKERSWNVKIDRLRKEKVNKRTIDIRKQKSIV
jgi:hypothetical protein